LVYQVAWGKALGLVFGHTVYAIATVLAVFMGGLALGSAYWGKSSERSANSIRLYGWMEIAVAAGGALSLAGLAGVRSLYLHAYHLVAGSVPALLLLRFAGSAIVLLLPTFLMGGTLPVLVQGVTRTSAELGRRVSRLYWVNTFGAVAGTLAAGFLLLPTLGQRRTVGVAALLNILAGTIALVLARSVPTTHESAVRAASAELRGAAPPHSTFLLASFALVGGTAMAYEIGWTRLLATYLGSSTYAFTLMLATFLAGIVIGSLLFEAWSARAHAITETGYALTQTLTALGALGFLTFYEYFPTLLGTLLRATHDTFGGLVLAQCIISALTMLPTAVIFGFNFPLVTVLIARRSGLQAEYSAHGAAVGRAYAANTLGAILGATSVGFFLMPRIGAFRLLAMTAAANLALALILRMRAARAESGQAVQRQWLAAACNAALLAAVCFLTFSGAFYDPAVATFAAVMYYDIYGGKLTAAEQAATVDVVFAEDGLNATISVGRAEDYIAERTNGKVDASNKDTLTQYMAGHLGMIFHPAPRRVLVIGFGSGMTVASVARYREVEHIDCVEIEPAVVHAAPHLEQLNRGVTRDLRVRIIFDDARNYLLSTREQYDLIISEPSNPWIAGVSALFTDEFYAQARAHLRPGGMLVQWVQGYALFPDDFRMVLSTFVPHFPRVTLWRGESPDYLLFAQTDLQPLRLERLRRLWSDEGLQKDYDALDIMEPEGLLAFHRLDDVDLRRLLDPALRNTDDNSRLEFRAPRALLSRGLDTKNLDLVWGRRTAVLPRDVIVDDPRPVLLAATETSLLLEDAARAAYFLRPLEDDPPDYDLEILRARVAYASDAFSEARDHFTTALRLKPSSLRAPTGLADVDSRLNDPGNAELLYRQVLARDPTYIRAYTGLVDLLSTSGRWAEAAKWQAQRIDAELRSDDDSSAGADEKVSPEETAKLGEYLLKSGDAQAAEKISLSTLDREPYSYDAHHNLADLYRARKDWENARAHYEFIVRYEPDGDPLVYPALAEVYRALGRPSAAAAVLRKGLRVFPDNALLKRLVNSP
jgi:spermidine synthase